MHEYFTVRNVKCGGCVKAIQQGLQGLPGVQRIEVVIDGGKVSVEGDALDRAQLAAKLSELGYPEAE
ncbi:MAG: heavy-metal-associated domain-containing protein [Gammaproteobacteria bacterium]